MLPGEQEGQGDTQDPGNIIALERSTPGTELVVGSQVLRQA